MVFVSTIIFCLLNILLIASHLEYIPFHWHVELCEVDPHVNSRLRGVLFQVTQVNLRIDKINLGKK